MNIKKWRKISIIVCLVLGTLLHFTYEWSGENKFVALFSAVNESTWEHLKLSFFPMFIMFVIGYFLFGKNTNNYIKGNVTGILFSIAFVTIFFYTYTGIIGRGFGIVNILTFVVSIILGEYISYIIINNSKSEQNSRIYLIVLCIFLVSFLIFTFYPPQIAYFKDPITGLYGIMQ